ncbi:c-type cytochrome [Amylibacter sp.]|nr:c-type cytochrome [Amylibacter sp.]
MALLLAFTLFHGSVFAENISSISSGAKIFKKCQNCHQIGEDAKNRVGPQLNNIFGRTAGGLPGVKYSKSMVQAGEEGLVWNNETLNSFIENPKKLIVKTRMSFSGLIKEDDRKNLLLYLSQFSKDATKVKDLENFTKNKNQNVDPTILSIVGDPEYGEYLASECMTCHQSSGLDDGIPGINAWQTEDFVIAMHAYKKKQRPHPVMQMMAGRLTNEEIAALAAYFKDLN